MVLMSQKARPRIFYGWWMVGAGFVIQFLTGGLLQQSFGAYVSIFREQFGWSKTALSGAYSMQQLEMGVLAPAQGWIMDRFGPRVMMQIGVVTLGIGFILLSQVNSIGGFYAATFIMALGATLSGFFPLTVAIVNWFERHRAKAISITSIGFAFGGVTVPVVSYCLENLGWRETLAGAGIMIMLIGLPATQMIRRRPEEYGEVVDGIHEPSPPRQQTSAEATSTVATAERATRSRDFTFREAMRTRAFWMINLGHGTALLVVSAVNVHVISHLQQIGYSLGTAALIVTFMTTMQIVGMMIGGMLGDKADGALMATACMAMHATGLLLVAYAVNFPMVFGFAVLHGLAWGTRGPLMQAIRADYFGRTAFATIMGVSTMLIMFGNISGPLIAGSLADITGGYKTGFTVLAILAGLGSVFFILAKKPALPETSDAATIAAATAGG